jgi:Fe2+ or Zn2+ uptake regulation protein
MKMIFNFRRAWMNDLLQSPDQDWLNRLQASGYRLTGPRRAIVEIMAASPRALGPMDVFDLGRKDYPGLGLVTVYRTLEKLEALGLVQRVHQPNGCHMYLPATHGHEHLLLCTVCGRAEVFSGDDLGTLIDGIAGRSGYEIHEHLLQLFGLCGECRNLKP